eukprot:512989-Karenia_brevis.AAC.1
MARAVRENMPTQTGMGLVPVPLPYLRPTAWHCRQFRNWEQGSFPKYGSANLSRSSLKDFWIQMLPPACSQSWAPQMP